MRRPYLLVALPASVATALAAFAFYGGFGWETGVEGTSGALLALAGAAFVAVGGLLAAFPGLRGRTLGALSALVGVAAFLTAVAAYFLMKPVFAVLMVCALVALFYADSRRAIR